METSIGVKDTSSFTVQRTVPKVLCRFQLWLQDLPSFTEILPCRESTRKDELRDPRFLVTLTFPPEFKVNEKEENKNFEQQDINKISVTPFTPYS